MIICLGQLASAGQRLGGWPTNLRRDTGDQDVLLNLARSRAFRQVAYCNRIIT